MKSIRPLVAFAFAALFVSAAALAETVSVADVHANRTELGGKQITVTGEVIKVNNGIMNRNFIHVDDDSGADPLTFTSQQTANVGDRVRATGTVKLDTDFGMGYFYLTLIEESTIEVLE